MESRESLKIKLPVSTTKEESSPKESIASTVGSPSSTPRGGRSPEKEFLLTKDAELAKDTVTKWMRDTYKQPPR